MQRAVFGGDDRVAPWQAPDLDAFELTEADVTTASYWVDAHGGLHRGHLGIAEALRAGRQPWRSAGWLLARPPLRWAAAAIYPVIAKNRFRLPGSTCQLPQR